MPGKNVVGVLEGTDLALKQEYVILSAHYDHIGVRRNESADSIYNGAPRQCPGHYRDPGSRQISFAKPCEAIGNHSRILR